MASSGLLALDFDDEVELLDYDVGTPGPEIITIEDDDDDDEVLVSRKPQRDQKHLNIQLPDIEEASWKLPNGIKITPGSTVELKDRARQYSSTLHSGDFLRIRHIIRNVETDEVSLRGFRLRRTKYLGPILDWKVNELVLILHVDENEKETPFVQGMVDVPTTEVLRVRSCIMTNKEYPAQSFRHSSVNIPIRVGSNDEAKEWIFHQARLVCRVVNILFIHKNGKAYGGEVRRLHSHEVDPEHAISPTLLHQGSSSENSIEIDDEAEDDVVVISKRGMRRVREDSAETVDREPRRALPTKTKRYTFGDCFCGAGGASQGAVQAGLTVCWGLDHDDLAIEAYSQNHLGALPFCGDAHDFPPDGATLKELKVDVLHLSPPCCYWSPAHTNEGQNDQANYDSIYTVGPILKKLKPRVATLEQTFGLATYEEHKNNFLLLMYDIIDAGYNLRYKIVNMSEYGLPQQRKRLLIIAARIGTPLPPFPQPTHGGPGSGLKRFVSVADALEPLERLGTRASNDIYHQPNQCREINREAYDPRVTMVKGCVTTSGGDSNYYHNGKRRFTPREFCLFQTFAIDYHFTGGKSEATKQIGNAFPPIMAEAVYRTIAKTLEAFDHELIDAEDCIEDLDAFLKDKGVVLPAASSRSPYRYLTRNNTSTRAPKHAASSSIFSRKTDIEPVRSTSRKRGASTALPFRLSRQRRRVLADAELAEETGDLIVLD